MNPSNNIHDLSDKNTSIIINEINYLINNIKTLNNSNLILKIDHIMINITIICYPKVLFTYYNNNKPTNKITNLTNKSSAILFLTNILNNK
jgi:hypothetical protein